MTCLHTFFFKQLEQQINISFSFSKQALQPSKILKLLIWQQTTEVAVSCLKKANVDELEKSGIIFRSPLNPVTTLKQGVNI